jgi:hypothetical protein
VYKFIACRQARQGKYHACTAAETGWFRQQILLKSPKGNLLPDLHKFAAHNVAALLCTNGEKQTLRIENRECTSGGGRRSLQLQQLNKLKAGFQAR